MHLNKNHEKYMGTRLLQDYWIRPVVCTHSIPKGFFTCGIVQKRLDKNHSALPNLLYLKLFLNTHFKAM